MIWWNAVSSHRGHAEMEYYTTTVQNDDSTGIVACLNEAGAKGWELVAVA
jgi:hypothetical protein